MATVAELLAVLRADSTQFSATMARAAAQTKGLETSASRFSRAAKIGFTVVGAAVVKATVDFIRFETTMTRLQTLAGATEVEVRSLSKSVLDMAGPLATSPQALAEGLYFVYSAGIKGAAAMETLEFAAKGAAIGMGTVETVADATTSVLNAYGTANISAGEATAILREAVEQSKREADEMAESIGRVLPIAAEMGVEFEQVAGAMAAMTRTGLDANEAATALRGIMVGILDPTQRAQEMLKAYGLSVKDLQGAIRSGNMVDVLLALKDAFGENERALSILFPNVRALVGALNLVGDNADSAREAFANVAEATVSDLNEAFETFADTTEGRVRAAWAYLQSALIEFGGAVAPVVGALANLVAILSPLLRILLPLGVAWAAMRGAAVLIPAVLTAISAAAARASVMVAAFQVQMNLARVGLQSYGSAIGQTARGILNSIGATTAWTAALVAVGLAINAVSKYLGQAQDQADIMSEAVLAGTSTLQDWHREIKRIEGDAPRSELYKAFILSTEDVTAAIKEQNQEILAGTGLYPEWGDALNDITSQNQRLHANVAELILRLKAQNVELTGSQDRAIRAKLATGDLEGAIRILSKALGIGKEDARNLGSATDALADAHNRAAEAARKQREAEAALAGGLLAILSGTSALRDSQQTLNDLRKDGKAGTQEYRDAQAQLLENQLSLNQTFAEYITDLKASGLSQEQAVQKLVRLGRQAGLSKEQVLRLLDPLERFRRKLNDINRIPDIEVGVTTIFRTTGNAPPGFDPRQVYDHEGGLVGRMHRGGAVHRMHSGGARLRSDERPSILQIGEFVIQKRAVDALGVPLLRALNSARRGWVRAPQEVVSPRVRRLTTPGHGLTRTEAAANAFQLSRRERDVKITVRPDRRRMNRDLHSDYVNRGW
jgi:TP901 family phage tail tape measure protein